MYPDLQLDDAKVIDRICTYSKLIFQHESNKHRTKMKNKKHTALKWEIKTNRIVQRRRNHKNKWKKKPKICGNHLFNKDRKKNNSVGDFGSKLTLNHPSSVDKRYRKRKFPLKCRTHLVVMYQMYDYIGNYLLDVCLTRKNIHSVDNYRMCIRGP